MTVSARPRVCALVQAAGCLAYLWAGSAAAWGAADDLQVRFTPPGQMQNPQDFTREGDEFTAPELIDGDTPINLLWSQTPVSVRWRQIYQGAVSDDGGWMDVPGAQAAGAWQNLTPARQMSVTLDQDTPAPALPWPAQMSCAQEPLKGDNASCARWQALYATCQGGDHSPCYSYPARLALEVKLAADTPVQTYYLLFPGGC